MRDSSLFYYEERPPYLVFVYFPHSALYARSIETTSPLYQRRPLRIRIKYRKLRFNLNMLPTLNKIATLRDG